VIYINCFIYYPRGVKVVRVFFLTDNCAFSNICVYLNYSDFLGFLNTLEHHTISNPRDFLYPSEDDLVKIQIKL